jgi:predicted MFS family arabinose efflux permease
MPRWSSAPEYANPARRHNYAAVQRESAAMGIVNAAGIFFPVFLVRIGGTNLEIGLLTAIPALTGFLLAIPIGTFLQSRRNIVPWYSASRGLGQLVYAATAIAVAVVPREALVPVILALWALVTIPTTIGSVAFNVVMDGAAGPRGRYDLLSRRWSIMGLTTAITVAITGQVLDQIGFALNYQIVFFVFSAAGLLASWYSLQIRVPDHPPREHVPGASWRDRLHSYVATIRAEPAFLWFVARQWVLTFGLRVAAPLIPLWYIREAHAPDAWIGLIGTAQSLALLVGYYSWRRLSRRYSTRLLLAVVTVGVALYPGLLVLSRDLVIITVITAYGALIGAGFDLVLFDELMKTIPPKHAVTFSAVQTSLANLAAIVAPLAGGSLADQIGIAPGLIVAAAITLAGALLFITAPKRTQVAPVRPTRSPPLPSGGDRSPDTVQGG